MNTNEQHQVVEDIEKILSWYEKNSDSEKATIEVLLRASDKLSVLSVNLARIVGLSKGTYLRAYFQRKYHQTTRNLHWIEKGQSQGWAKEKSIEESKEQMEDEFKTEEIHAYMSLLLQQLNKVLSAIQQRISFAKIEQQKMEHLGNNLNQK